MTSCVTCKVCQAQLLKTMLPIFLIIDHDGQSVLVLVQTGAPDDTQVVQGQAAELIDGEEDVASHLLDGLQGLKCRNKENQRK